ncbi:MAG: phage tail tape measure protein, partial [Desulfofundulus sp.]
MPSIGQIWADFGIKNNVKEGIARAQADLKAASKQIEEQLKQAGEIAGKSLGEGVKATSGQLREQMRFIQAQFKQATAELGLNASEVDKLRVKSEALNRQLEVQQQIVQSLNERYQKAIQVKGENSKEATRLATSLANAKAAEASIRNELQRVNDEITKQTTAVGRLRGEWRKEVEEARSSFSSAFDQMRAAGTVITAAGAGIAAGLGAAVAKSADFGAQMAKVQVLSDATAEEIQKLRQAALEIGPTMGFSADQASAAMQQLAASGYNAQQITAMLPAVMSAAAAAGEDLGLATELVASQLQSYKMSATQAGHVSDMLAQAANISAVGLQDLNYSLKYAGPVAASVGISFEELTAAIAVMGNQGIKGEQAGTTLRAALLRLIDPPKEARVALQQLGISITDSHGKMRPLADIIGQLQTKMKGMTDAQKAQTLSTIFSTEAVSGMLALIRQGPSVLSDYTKQLQNSAGASEKAAKAMQ